MGLGETTAMGHNCAIRFNEDSRVNSFTFYVWPRAIFSLLLTDWVSLNFYKSMLLNFSFYTLLYPMGHNCSIGTHEDSRVNGFTFYILHCAIFSWVVINWLGKFEHLEMYSFIFCLLYLATSHGSQLLHRVKWRLKCEWFYILHFTLCYFFMCCYKLIG